MSPEAPWPWRFKRGEVAWWNPGKGRPRTKVVVMGINEFFNCYEISVLNRTATGPAPECELEPLNALERLAEES